MKAIILAGGKGSRLKPITDFLPKPLVEIDGKPILFHIIKHLKKYSITDIVISVCYKANDIMSACGDGTSFGVTIKYIHEPINNPMGTAGALLKVKSLLDDTFIVTYGDILRELDVSKIINFHRKKNAFATIALYKRFVKNPKSLVEFYHSRKISSFIEIPTGKNLKKTHIWSNASFYLFEPNIYDFIPTNVPSDFSIDIFPEIILHKDVYSYSSEGYVLDIGNLEKLEIARKIINIKPGV